MREESEKEELGRKKAGLRTRKRAERLIILSPSPHEQRVETTPLGTQEASEVDPTLHRSVVVGTEPVDQHLPIIRPVTEQEDVDLRTGLIRRYPHTALASRGRPDHGTIGRHEADLLFQSVGVGHVVGEVPFFYR